MASSPYATHDEVLLEEIQAAAERQLDAQLTAALAADQRALIFAGFVAAAAAALAGAAASILAGQAAHPLLGWLALGAAAGMIAAMVLAVYAARPTDWYFPGGRPEDWVDDIAAGKPRAERLQELIADYNNRLVRNETTMKKNGQLLKVATILALLTLLLSSLFLAGYAGSRPARVAPAQSAASIQINFQAAEERPAESNGVDICSRSGEGC